MKNKLSILFFLIYNLCSSQIDIDFSNLSVTESRVDSINLYFDKVLKSDGEKKKELEKLFFELLPNSHSEMSDAMYIDAVKKVQEREKNKYKEGYISKILIPNPWVKYLSKMDYYDKDVYYDKYFNICIGGEYGADYLRAGFEIYERFLSDTKIACEKLERLTDKQIESIFYFIFDEIHPEHNEENISLYKKMLSKIKVENVKLSELLEKTYKRIITEQRNH
ncbi:hypothetical protein [Winogradskyella alexanderae]|uniref:DUF4375 domain-containing protein n=1 Tax=Winogradskyella alexanderae TaxID=2877123 RepID=A0ABS7XWZ3_9FLAO|nr:hypothetical protein [Winogradskyella alexanderae]MCA0133914.1 hypothetical protein [Winogradskyella alexanderae]